MPPRAVRGVVSYNYSPPHITGETRDNVAQFMFIGVEKRVDTPDAMQDISTIQESARALAYLIQKNSIGFREEVMKALQSMNELGDASFRAKAIAKCEQSFKKLEVK